MLRPRVALGDQLVVMLLAAWIAGWLALIVVRLIMAIFRLGARAVTPTRRVRRTPVRLDWLHKCQFEVSFGAHSVKYTLNPALVLRAKGIAILGALDRRRFGL